MAMTRNIARSGRCFTRVLPFVMIVLALQAAMGCSGGARYFRTSPGQLKAPATIAVMPLLNMSRYEQAETIVMHTVVVELLNIKDGRAAKIWKIDRPLFEVVDPGLVETVILEKRLRFTDRLSLEQLQEMGERLSVEYLLVGTVNEFDFVNDGNVRLPSVSISLRIVTCANGKMVWASTHSKRGDDAETVFGLGRVESLEQLAAKTVREMTKTLQR
jgi:TolB-like protein